MSNRWLLLIIVAVAVVGFGAGLVVAQEGLNYPYLPAKYSEPYIPTLAEWQALRCSNSFNEPLGLGPRIAQTSFNVTPLYDCLMLTVQTKCQPAWDMYGGAGRFRCSDRELRATYNDAALRVIENLHIWFPNVKNKDLRIHFSVAGGLLVGTWQGGEMTLEGEE